MKRFWQVILVFTLALALPLRVSAMPHSDCCLVGMDASASHVTDMNPINGAMVDAEGGCNANGASSALGCPTKMAQASCTAMCAVLGAAPMPVPLAVGAWTSVLVPHPESNFLSIALALLERPPKAFSV